ncbi:hypothetical protein Bbelb_266330 [Branchiostoma belcheri]|nr:hypothetical protein Bbelb_266330 [Branchiostoma belcheri]
MPGVQQTVLLQWKKTLSGSARRFHVCDWRALIKKHTAVINQGAVAKQYQLPGYIPDVGQTIVPPQKAARCRRSFSQALGSAQTGSCAPNFFRGPHICGYAADNTTT